MSCKSRPWPGRPEMRRTPTPGPAASLLCFARGLGEAALWLHLSLSLSFSLSLSLSCLLAIGHIYICLSLSRWTTLQHIFTMEHPFQFVILKLRDSSNSQSRLENGGLLFRAWLANVQKPTLRVSGSENRLLTSVLERCSLSSVWIHPKWIMSSAESCRFNGSVTA